MEKYTDGGAVSLAELENGTWSRNFGISSRHTGAQCIMNMHRLIILNVLLACKNEPYV